MQLRNLLWATSAFDFYYLSDNIIMLYNSLSHRSSEVRPSPAEASQWVLSGPPNTGDIAGDTQVLNLSGRPATAVAPNVGRVPISTMCVSHGLVAAGGFYGIYLDSCMLLLAGLACVLPFPWLTVSIDLTYGERSACRFRRAGCAGATGGAEIPVQVCH